MLNYFKKINFINKKNLAVFIFTLILVSTIGSQNAKAAVPTFDVGLNPLLAITQPTIVDELAILNTMQASQHLKEVGIPPWPPALSAIIGGGIGLDEFGWIVAKLALATLMEQVVNWVRTANIDGGPLFVQNWGHFLLNARDKASDLFARELIQSNICQPFAIPIQEALTNNIIGLGQPLNQQVDCTFEDTIGSMQLFFDDFSAGGGWAAWESLTQESENNPYIVYLTGLINLDNRQAQGVSENEQEAETSQGFLSTADCQDVEIPTENGPVIFEECTFTTPGKSVETELSKVLETNLENLNLADELDEALAAILQGILQNIIFSVGGIIRGVLAPVPPPPATPNGQPAPIVCGDNICAVSENPLNCPVDCQPGQVGIPPPPPPPPSTLTAVYLGITGEDLVGPANQTTANGAPDFHIRVGGLRTTPIRSVRIINATGGVWVSPYNGNNWIVSPAQLDGAGNGDFWIEPAGGNPTNITITYTDGTTDTATIP